MTELVLGFDRSFATTELLACQQQLFDDLHAGLIALPINLPGMGRPLSTALDPVLPSVSLLTCLHAVASAIAQAVNKWSTLPADIAGMGKPTQAGMSKPTLAILTSPVAC